MIARTILECHELKGRRPIWPQASCPSKNDSEIPGHVVAVVFGPDGKRLATASADTTAKVWDAVSGEELLTLRGHSLPVAGVAFSPDGRHLATASADGTVQIFTLDIRELLELASKRVTRSLNPDECKHYFRSGTCPPLL